MKGGSSSSGFTIVEVLIVLAVTGILFVSAAVMIAGRQNQTQFDQSIRQIQSQIQQTINEVSIGYYPNLNNFKCSASGASLSISSGSSGQGTNTGCVFLGKVMQFGVNNTDPEQFITFTLAGLQQDASGNQISSLANARPLVIASSPSHSDIPNGYVTSNLEGGLTSVKMSYNGTPIGAVAFVSNLAPSGSGSVISGSQQIGLVPINGTALGASPSTTADAIDNALASGAATINPTNGVQLCIASGTTNQSGLITIGGGSRDLNVTLDIKGNKTCS
jgi:prepilin-type N-terminal cleavage/methylation domain-containing protein